ncbi:hypothetical protein J3A83DRAFT_4260864 [Scleroderma citrinum]
MDDLFLWLTTHSTTVCLGALGALTFMWGRTSSKIAFITDYSKVASEIGSQESDLNEYDYIIVGGGTAGCVLASRLSEDPKRRVLVIEAGSSGTAVLESRVPAAYKKIVGTPHDYNLWTVPQPHAENKKVYWPRARLLGGCSSINAQMAQYGSPSDFDELATIVGDDSWSWENLKKYFRKFESYSPHPRFPDVNVSEHGSSGPMTIGYHAHIWKGSEMFIQACINAGVKFSPDFNTSKGTMGVNKTVTYIDSKGVRVSTEAAYFTPSVLARPNLKVVTEARVTRILFGSPGSDGSPRATGVEFAAFNRMKADKKFRARASKEVVVCCGTVHTPQLLMLSGIGPALHLAEHDITLVLDAQGVGSNLSDHPAFHLRLAEKMGISLNYLAAENIWTMLRFLKDFVRYKLTGTGPLSSNLGEAAAFCRSDDPALFPPSEYKQDVEDTTSGPGAPDLELIVIPAVVHPQDRSLEGKGNGYMLVPVLLRPTSVGTIRLQSSDPWDNPLIDPNYLSTRHDMDVMVRGVRLAYKIAHTAPMSDLTDTTNKHPSLDHHFGNLTDDEISQAVRDRIETTFHPFGTCPMGQEGDGRSVLNSQMKVRGVSGLRVCDASIFPKLVSGHTAGIVIAAAEKLADIIKEEYTTS